MSTYSPPAAQLRGDGHHTELTQADPLAFSAPDLGTSTARPRQPFCPLTTKACAGWEPSM
jgi:hypothetical protein